MKRRILALGVVLALVAVMALPMPVFAASTGTTGITGSLVVTFTLVAPSNFALGTGGTLGIGANAGSSATAGSVITNVAGWTLTVADAKTTTKGHMTLDGLDVAGTGLDNYIQVGMTAPVAGNIATSIEDYSTALGVAPGRGDTGTFSIPLYANQTVVGTDAAGSYKISLTYTATPGI